MYDSTERYGPRVSQEVALQSIPQSHSARAVPPVHVQLKVQRNGGNCDRREASGSVQEVRVRTGGFCAINGAIQQLKCSALRYIYRHVFGTNISLSTVLGNTFSLVSPNIKLKLHFGVF